MYALRNEIITYEDLYKSRSPLLHKLTKHELMTFSPNMIATFRMELCLLFDNLHYVYRNGKPIKPPKRKHIDSDVCSSSKKVTKILPNSSNKSNTGKKRSATTVAFSKVNNTVSVKATPTRKRETKNYFTVCDTID
jgi:hypothetical protein